MLGPGAFVIRFFGEEEDRLLLINLKSSSHLDPAPEPLLAPLDGCTGSYLVERDLRYGGSGMPPVYSEENWRLPGRSAVVMRPEVAPPHMRHKAEGEDREDRLPWRAPWLIQDAFGAGRRMRRNDSAIARRSG